MNRTRIPCRTGNKEYLQGSNKQAIENGEIKSRAATRSTKAYGTNRKRAFVQLNKKRKKASQLTGSGYQGKKKGLEGGGAINLSDRKKGFSR